MSNIANEISKTQQKEKMLGKIAEILERKNIAIEDIGDIKQVSLYQQMFKNDQNEAEVQDLAAIQFSPKWEQGPEWPVIQRGPVQVIEKKKTPRKVRGAFQKDVIVPDAQIGYYRGKDGELHETHDEKAIAVVMQAIELIQPTTIVCVGDNLDLPEMGKYLTTPAYQQTTQAAIDRATTFCAQMRAAAPKAKIVWLAGNHEERMPKYLLTNAAAAYGLRKGNTPDSWPVLTIPYLCRMEEYGVEYRPGYPASDYWINEKLRVIHGDRVKSSGSTAHVYLNNEKTSVIYGHIHRIETAFKTREDFSGPRTIMAASPGCLARIDGAVPSTKGGVDLDGRPLTRYENWQQGFGVVTYETNGEHRFKYEVMPIYNGWSMYENTELFAKVIETKKKK